MSRGFGETENKDLTLAWDGVRIVGHETSRTPSSPKLHNGDFILANLHVDMVLSQIGEALGKCIFFNFPC